MTTALERTAAVTADPRSGAAPRPATVRPRRRFRLTWTRPVLHLIVVVFMVVWFTPVLSLFVTSVRTQSDTAANGWWNAFVQPLFTGYNYQQAMSVIGVGGSLATSLAIAVPVTVLTTVLSALGAYALTRMRFAGRTILSLVLVAMLVIPPQVTLVPMLRFFNATGLQGTIPSVWIYQVGFTIPFGIFLLRGFMASIPQELFESAALDGAGALRVFRSVVLPLSIPVMASLAIMQFLWSWNDLLIPLIFLGGSDMSAPITVQVAGLVQSNGQGESLVMAATFVSILVPLVLVVSLQRYFVRGVLGGAVKG
ncbi:carbohydrate ABC transporter permease [Leifsonia sp. C5G2]|uniref:carbohydrate ABC transporter permease n=1 Tax=Leifsonia sp. C5G2 TaxID=2735269 RepID=UPI001584D37B|nr:carbohydrate ABC transporter permease [Leifsonia sp. C5G2]NUU05258.1 carbohydrate ABC transporter permease [Leifsonia sp. C5G2]